MAAHRVIVGGGAQALYTQPIRGGAALPVASATYRIVDLLRIETDALYETVAAGTAATISSVSTTITADAGKRASSPDVISAASATGITSGRAYLLTSSSLAREVVIVASISGTTIKLERDVSGDFRSGATLTGYELAAEFPAAQANDQNDFDAGRTLFAVDWTYDGRTTRELVQIVRTAAYCPVPASALASWVPEVGSRIGDSFKADDYVSAAWLHVRSELMRHRVKPDELYTDDALAATVCYRAASRLFMQHSGDQAEGLAEAYERDYRAALSGIVTGLEKPGAVTVTPDGRARRRPERRGVIASR